jgi:hypothetical protein
MHKGYLKKGHQLDLWVNIYDFGSRECDKNPLGFVEV